jgi:hypothetical protein
MAKQTLSGGKEYRRWEKVGQEMTGILVKLELSRSSRGGKMLHMVDADGVPFMVSAPTLLAEIIEENFPTLEGRNITITFSEQDKPAKRGESGLMRFTVDYDDAEKQEGDAEGTPRGRT